MNSSRETKIEISDDRVSEKQQAYNVKLAISRSI